MNPFERAREKDIVSVIGRDVELRKSGHIHMGLCPFHEDIEPSLAVYQDSFYCFGCQLNGSVIDYVALREGCSILEAARKLVAGSSLPYERRPVRQKPIAPAVPQWVLGYWCGKLLTGRRMYFTQRGFTDKTIDEQMLGWTGLRYVIPVWDGVPGESKVFQVQLRRCDELYSQEELANVSKYVNLTGHGTPQLYGKWALRGEQETAFLFMGVLTALMAIQDGFEAASPTNGVRTWNDEWSVHFAGYEKVYVIQDQTASERDATFLTAARIGGHARVIPTPDGAGDYADWRLEHSAEEFRDYLGQFDEKGK